MTQLGHAATAGIIEDRPAGEGTSEVERPAWNERRLLVVGGFLALGYALIVLVFAARSADLGFFVFHSRRITAVRPGSAAAAAGLRHGDEVLAVGAGPCRVRDCVARLSDLRAGDTVQLTIRRGADTHFISYRPPRRMPLGSAAGVALGALLLGIALLADRGVTRGAPRRFYVSSVVYVILFAGAFSWDAVVLQAALGMIWGAALIIAAPVTCHFSLVFPGGPARVSRGTLALLYAPPLVLITGMELYYGSFAMGWLDGHKTLQSLWDFLIPVGATVLAPAYLGWGAIARWRRLHRVTGIDPQSARWSRLGALAMALPMTAGAISAAFDLESFIAGGFAKYLAVTAVGGASCMILALMRTPLGELDRVLRNGAGYFLATVVAGIAYFGAVALAGTAGTAQLGTSLAATLIAAAIFGPLRGAMQRKIDERFRRQRERARALVAAAADAALRNLDAASMAKEVVERLHDAMPLAGAALYEEDPEGAFVLQARAGTLMLGDRIGFRDPVRDHIAHSLGCRAIREIGREIGGGVLAVPLEISTRQAAALIVAAAPGERLHREHIELLETLSKQLVVALRNARAHAELAAASARLARQAEVAERQRREIQRLKERVEEESRMLAAELSRQGQTAPVIGAGLRPTYERAQQIAASDSTVLVRGETGTGKELLAAAIHAWSPRAKGPFVVVDCGAIPAGVFESTLFGHERGAFTGAARRKIGLLEAADGGTLFLDEIGELPLDMQPKLLGAIERRSIIRVGGDTPIPVDVRIVAATHRKLEDEVAAGRFRRDLLYRLRVFELLVPPLRERKQDIPQLCAHFLEQVARKRGTKPKSLAPEALAAVLEYDWQGNVRELENSLERAALLAEEDAIRPVDLSVDDELFRRRAAARLAAPVESGGLRGTLESLERERLSDTLRQCGGNRSQAARALGIKRASLLRRLKRYGLA
jgi:transcriptional regulator with PAS, ATPase and Fis domain